MIDTTNQLSRTREGRAVLATTKWDPDHVAWAPGIRAALARNGTRDAVIVLTARNRHWTRARTALLELNPVGRLTVDHNIATIIAISWWADGDTAAALAALPAQGSHRMADLIRSMIDRGVTGDQWMQRIVRVDPLTCLQHPG